MKITRTLRTLAVLATLATSATSRPIERPLEPRFFTEIGEAIGNFMNGAKDKITEKASNILLFNNPITQTAEGFTMRLRAQIFEGEGENKLLLKLAQPLLDAFGIKVNKDNEATLQQRTSLFFAKPGAQKSITVNVAGCQNPITVKSDVTGRIDTVVDLGACSPSYEQKVSATVEGGKSVDGNAFASGPSGFGVISDIDDTIKITNVLDKPKAAQAAFVDDLVAVPGMPEFYAQLKTQLPDLFFNYLSGSPNQLITSLQPFLDRFYPTGPVFTKDLAFTSIAQIIDSINELDTQKFKVGEIDKIKEQYPQKNFLAIGDSTEKDPEAYAEAFNKHNNVPQQRNGKRQADGNRFIQCILIRRVQGADNSEARFNSAFKGIPQKFVKVFDDPKELMNIDFANGKCN